MLSNLKELLKSKDEENIKQAIDLILHLGLEDELYKSFKRTLSYCDLESLQFSKGFRKNFHRVTENVDTDEQLAKACLLALLCWDRTIRYIVYSERMDSLVVL